MFNGVSMKTISLFCLLSLAVSPLGLATEEQTNPAFEYPYYARSVYDSSRPETANHMMILNSGIASLEKRLEMIRKAKHSIELEYFIYDPDNSGKIIITELIKKSLEGVRVRILLDKSITIIRFDEYYADALRKYGIEVRYYNRAVDPSTAQFRNHRKLLSIDKSEALTGGRNIGLDYFDMSPTYNFHDRDVWVKGPIVNAMVDSFDAFWSSNRTVEAVVPYVPEVSRLHRDTRRVLPAKNRVHERRKKEAEEFMIETPELRDLKERLSVVGRWYLSQKEAHICPSLTYVSDKPTGSQVRRLTPGVYKSEDRLLNQVLKSRLLQAKESVFMETPYFMINKSFGEMMGELLDRGVDTKVLTNSLGSTDAIYVSANFYRQIGDWIQRGLKTYVHTSRFQGERVYDEMIRNTRYGIHSKTFVIDGVDFTIGTYNVDNRSDFYNTEMSLFCEGSPELAKILLDNMNLRLENAYELLDNGLSARDDKGNSADAYGGADESTIRLMRRIRIPTQLLEFLM